MITRNCRQDFTTVDVASNARMPGTYQGSNSCMMLSKRMTAKSLEAKPEIQASRRTVKVMRELRPAAFVSVEDFICLVDDLLSGNMTFALADDEDDVDEEDDGDNCCCCCWDDDDDDDLFGNMFSRCPSRPPRAR